MVAVNDIIENMPKAREGGLTNRRSDVETAGDAGGAHEVPVRVTRGQLLVDTELHHIHPRRELHLATLLQIVGDLLHSLLLVHILHASWLSHLDPLVVALSLLCV